MTDPRQDITLSQLTQAIEACLKETLEPYYWLVAEISELRIDQRGHCYMTFVEKDDKTGNIAARMSAHCWNYRYKQLATDFGNTTGTILSAGMKILCCVEIDMHSVYGISLDVVDIDANYTIGELQRLRQQTIERLKKEGVFESNKKLQLSKIPNRIAVISSEKAAGYDDFMRQLTDNGYGFRFTTRLYPALMQGDNAPLSIINALEKINNDIELYDCIVIIRGGGASSDMNCFDDYELASHCAQIQLPVLTGIGHTRDISVVDMVAYQSLKTPTAVAEWIVEILAEQYTVLYNMANELRLAVKAVINTERQNITILAQQLRHSSQLRIQDEVFALRQLTNELLFAGKSFFAEENQRLQNIEREIAFYEPAKIFSRGYSLLRDDSDIIRSKEQITPEKIITATLPDQSEVRLRRI